MKSVIAAIEAIWTKAFITGSCRRATALNILSMRSVIRKPLTMLFVIEAKSAIAPRMRMLRRIVRAGDDDRPDDGDRRDRVGERHEWRVGGAGRRG